MAELDAILQSLLTVPLRQFRGGLARCVALVPLTAHGTPDYLFTSGKANRYNPRGVSCIYFSEDERTAFAEYHRHLGATNKQPRGTFFAEVKLANMIDLEDSKTLEALGLKLKDLSTPWVGTKKPTKTQLLGLAISRQRKISAVRFPSDAAKAAKFKGFNLVIFADSVQAPDSLKIIGPDKKPLQMWP